MKLKYINVEDKSGQTLRIRFQDSKMVGYCAFEPKLYAETPITEEQEKDLWRHVVEVMKEVYEDEIYLTPEFQTEFSLQFDSGVASIEYDLEAGEITIKENTALCQSLTTANTSIQERSSKPPISKKAKPRLSSKSLKKSTHR